MIDKSYQVSFVEQIFLITRCGIRDIISQAFVLPDLTNNVFMYLKNFLDVTFLKRSLQKD